jgi:hypothetical protein
MKTFLALMALAAFGCGGGGGRPDGAGGGAGAGGTGPGGAGGSGGTGVAGSGGAGGSGAGGSGGGTQPADAGSLDARPRDAAPAPDAAPAGGSCPDTAGPGSTVDPRSCLVWEKQLTGNLTNKQAAKRCDTLTLDGHDDWRVPAPEELAAWADLPVDSNATITNPIYIPTGATEMDGCLGNSHSCNISRYNTSAVACAWQGVGFSGPSLCVRGTARAGTLSTAHLATQCDACRVHVTGPTADFKQANCLPFAN